MEVDPAGPAPRALLALGLGGGAQHAAAAAPHGPAAAAEGAGEEAEEGEEEDLDRPLTDREASKILQPLLRLRQACCHPQVGKQGAAVHHLPCQVLLRMGPREQPLSSRWRFSGFIYSRGDSLTVRFAARLLQEMAGGGQSLWCRPFALPCPTCASAPFPAPKPPGPHRHVLFPSRAFLSGWLGRASTAGGRRVLGRRRHQAHVDRGDARGPHHQGGFRGRGGAQVGLPTPLGIGWTRRPEIGGGEGSSRAACFHGMDGCLGSSIAGAPAAVAPPWGSLVVSLCLCRRRRSTPLGNPSGWRLILPLVRRFLMQGGGPVSQRPGRAAAAAGQGGRGGRLLPRGPCPRAQVRWRACLLPIRESEDCPP